MWLTLDRTPDRLLPRIAPARGFRPARRALWRQSVRAGEANVALLPEDLVERNSETRVDKAVAHARQVRPQSERKSIYRLKSRAGHVVQVSRGGFIHHVAYFKTVKQAGAARDEFLQSIRKLPKSE